MNGAKNRKDRMLTTTTSGLATTMNRVYRQRWVILVLYIEFEDLSIGAYQRKHNVHGSSIGMP